MHVAGAALAHFQLQALHFLPAPQPPHKRSRQMTPIEVRLLLLRLAVAGEPRYVVDETEVRRGGSSYTFDTLSAVRARCAADDEVEICFVIGGDSLVDLPGWHRARELVSEFTLITVPRDPHQRIDDLLAPAIAALPPAAVDKLRRHVLPVEPLPISSTEIRALCRRGTTRQELAAWVPDAVAERILKDGIYADGGGAGD